MQRRFTLKLMYFGSQTCSMKKFSTLRPKIEISTRRGATVNVERPKQPSAFSTRLDHLINSGISYAKIDAV